MKWFSNSLSLTDHMEADDDDGDDDDDTSTSTKFHNIFCVRLSTYFHFHLKAFGHVGFLFASIILFVLFCFSLMTFYFVSRFYLLLFQILLCRDRDTSSLNLCSFVSEYGLATNEKENLEKTQIYFLASLRLHFFSFLYCCKCWKIEDNSEFTLLWQKNESGGMQSRRKRRKILLFWLFNLSIGNKNAFFLSAIIIFQLFSFVTQINYKINQNKSFLKLINSILQGATKRWHQMSIHSKRSSSIYKGFNTIYLSFSNNIPCDSAGFVSTYRNR